MLTWREFSEVKPDMAAGGRDLLYMIGHLALAFIGTVRKDGGPRMHPMCPVIVDGGLYAFIEPRPKRHDLDRDGRYALHNYPPDKNEDAFFITGTAVAETDPSVASAVSAAFWAERKMDGPPPGGEKSKLYELLISTAMLTRTTGHGDWNPQHEIWRATP